MRHKLITVIFICLLCSASTIAFAHPGSTDEYGKTNCRKICDKSILQ